MNRRKILGATASTALITILPSTGARSTPLAQTTVAHPTVKEAKRTSLGLYMTPVEAAATMADEGARTLFIDIRTRGEMMFTGWAPMIDGNVPFVDVTEFWDWDDKEGRYQFEANPVFSQDVGKRLAAKGLSKTDRVIIMCRSGDRSARAIGKLVEAGYTRVYNQYEGFEGDLSPEGRRSVNGWKNAGLAWTYKPDKAKFYTRGA